VPKHRLLVMCCIWVAAGCGSSAYVVVPAQPAGQRVPVDALVEAHPLADGQNIRVVELWRDGTAMSCHFVQVRDRESPHIHARHDLAVTVLQGSGELFLNGQPLTMRDGDAAIVPRGTAHYFVNRGTSPAVAFVTFAPAFDGADQVPVTP